MTRTTAIRTAHEALKALRSYESGCDRERSRISKEVFGHGGASIPEAAPTEQGRESVIADVLESLIATVRAETLREAASHVRDYKLRGVTAPTPFELARELDKLADAPR